MDDPREKKLRLAIKEMAIASSGKVLRGEAIFNLVHVLHERPVSQNANCWSRSFTKRLSWRENGWR